MQKLKVFLCYASKDKPMVRNLYQKLIADQYDAWLDEKKLISGQIKDLMIRKAVRKTDVVIVCLSKQFNQAGLQQKEMRLALDTAMEIPEGKIFIIPVRLEECDVPESLESKHWVNLYEENGYKELKRALDTRLEELEQQLDRAEVVEVKGEILHEVVRQEPNTSSNIEQTPSPNEPPKGNRRLLLIISRSLIALIIIAALSLLILYKVPYTLAINVSNETSKGVVTELPIIRTNDASTLLEAHPVKGDSPVTVEVHAFNIIGKEISPDALNYHWELCCDDKQNKTPYDSRLPNWKFEPPTYISTETLTIIVSNKNRCSVKAEIHFKITDH
jgi:hypothetical protein